MYEEYLMHHGVKGMKWGVRHDKDRKGNRKKGSNSYKGLYRMMGSDRGRFGKRGAARIQKYKRQGMTREQAVKKVARQKLAKNIAGMALLTGTVVAVKSGYAQKGAQFIGEFLKNNITGRIRVDDLGQYYDPGTVKNFFAKVFNTETINTWDYRLKKYRPNNPFG